MYAIFEDFNELKSWKPDQLMTVEASEHFHIVATCKSCEIVSSIFKIVHFARNTVRFVEIQVRSSEKETKINYNVDYSKDDM